ncbi:SOS response-associated peptidase [Candidatus Parcubacteria bacterium]|nr:MAG: SOS response-associated peptidase [Candidatus Parcubacteria bacterium]
MCGRYILVEEPQELEARFSASMDAVPYRPNYNAAPTEVMPVVSSSDPEKIVAMKWGIRPPWFRGTRGRSDGIINVRAENLWDKPTFRRALAERRCLVPADGFHEWQKTSGGKKIPFRFFRKDEDIFAFAGIWEADTASDGSLVRTFAILTTEPNELVAPVHNRMPVILPLAAERQWLDPGERPNVLLDLLRPYPAAEMLSHRVSLAVNKASNNGPELIKRIS